MVSDEVKPTINQKFAAVVRAFYEKELVKTRQPCKGFPGAYEVDSDRAKTLTAKKFGLKPRDISYFLTFSRYCTHPWSQGACKDCPPADHLPVPPDWNPTLRELYGKL